MIFVKIEERDILHSEECGADLETNYSLLRSITSSPILM